MNITKEYLAAAEADVKALSVINKNYWNEARYQILKKFCAGAEKLLSVGCGPREPIILNASHAVDISIQSYHLLKKNGWKGDFYCATSDGLPFADKFFDVVVCSEVIEHLPDLDIVRRTFLEVNRIAKRWIITTPNSAICIPKHQNPAHRQFFNPDSIKEVIPFDVKLYTNDHHIYMESPASE